MRNGNMAKGDVFTVPSNKHAEFNMYLDPLSAKTVLESRLNITIIPLGARRSISSCRSMLERLYKARDATPEAQFAYNLLSTLHHLQQTCRIYRHMVNLRV